MSMGKLPLPSGEKSVQNRAYAGRTDLTEVTVPEGVEVIETKAFFRCTALRRLCLPLSLRHIDMKAFEGCPLEEIYYAGSQAQWREVEISPVMSGSITAACKHFQGGSTPAPAARQLPDSGPALTEQVCRLLAGGGDGRLHVVVPNLAMDGVLTKPGDLSLLIFPQGGTLLLDTGYKANWPRVRAFLLSVGLRRVDTLALSHGDEDHVSNGMAIARLLLEEQGGSIGRLWWTGQPYGTIVPQLADYLAGQGVCVDPHVRAGRTEEIEGVGLEVLGPTEEDMQEDSQDGEVRNAQSMMLKLTYGKSTYLTCGDLYARQEERVIRRLGSRLRADVSKTNHHGGFTSNTPAWQEAVNSRIFFSCASDMGSTPMVRQLLARGAEYYSVGCHGLLLLSASADGIWQVQTQFQQGLRCLQRVNE